MFGFSLTEEQEQLRDTARRFAEQEIIPVAAEYDEAEKFPEPVARKAWELGLMNVEVAARVRRSRARRPRHLHSPGAAQLRMLRNRERGHGERARRVAAHHRRQRRAEEALPRDADLGVQLRRLRHH